MIISGGWQAQTARGAVDPQAAGVRESTTPNSVMVMVGSKMGTWAQSCAVHKRAIKTDKVLIGLVLVELNVLKLS